MLGSGLTGGVKGMLKMRANIDSLLGLNRLAYAIGSISTWRAQTKALNSLAILFKVIGIEEGSHLARRTSDLKQNKTVHKKRHHFPAQFSIPFHMVCSVLLRVLASKTIE